MEVGNVIIDTPYDGLMEWEPAWRYEVAKAWADMIPANKNFVPDVYSVADDRDVVGLKDFFVELNRGKKWHPNDDSFQDQRSTFDWYTSRNARKNPRAFLEPLFLTAASYESVASVMTGDRINPDRYRLYERLFFNIREDDGSLIKGHYTRLSAACDNNVFMDANTPREIVWRMTGFQLGYDMLVALWDWTDPEKDKLVLANELYQAGWSTAQARVYQKILTDSVSPQDLNGYLQSYTQHEKMLRETPEQTDFKAEAVDFAREILMVNTPTMKVAALENSDRMLSAANAGITSESLQSRFSAQKNISKHPIEDLGSEEGEEKLKEMMGEQFKNK